MESNSNDSKLDNMMKKTIIPIFVFLVLAIAVLAPPPVPAPVRGYFYINDQSVIGYVMEVENLRTGEVISGDKYIQLVTQSGGFAFDLSFFERGAVAEIEGVYPGDPLEVRARGLGDEGIVTFNTPSDTPHTITINIGTQRTDVMYQCWNGDSARELSLCPVQPEPEPKTETVTETKYVCTDGTSVDESAQCTPPETFI